MRKLIRNLIFNMLREDFLKFIEDNEISIRDLLQQEMELLDNKIPEENMYIDIKMKKLGNEVFQAVLNVTKRFLRMPRA